MAVLDAARAARYRDQDIYRSPERAERVVGERAPTYRTEALHFREDYGTSLDDLQYQGLERGRKAFEKYVSGTKSQITSSQSKIKEGYSQISEANKGLTSAYASASSEIPTWDNWLATESQSVDVYSDGEYEGSYRLAGQGVQDMAKSFQEYNLEAPTDMDWHNTETGIKIDVHGYGKEIHEKLGGYQAKTKSYFDQEVSRAKSGLASQYTGGQATLEGYKGSLLIHQTLLDAQRKQLAFQENERKAKLSDIRLKYSNRLARMKETIAAMQGGE